MNKPAVNPQAEKIKTLNNVLVKFKSEIAKALPKHMNPDRMVRVAMTCIRDNPALLECDPHSFFGAIIKSSSLGLEPGLQGHSYLIPYRNNKKGITECQFIPGYRGLIDLARRSGKVTSLYAHVVKENDFFEYQYGLDQKLDHIPAKSNRGKNTHVYAVARLIEGDPQFEVLSMEQIAEIRSLSKYPNPVWDKHFDEMCRKTAVRRLFKYLPTSIEMNDATNTEDAIDVGSSQDNASVILHQHDGQSIPENILDNQSADSANITQEPTSIVEENKKHDEQKKIDDKAEAVKAFHARIKVLKDEGFKDAEILAQLKVNALNDILLKDAATIYAALEVLAEV